VLKRPSRHAGETDARQEAPRCARAFPAPSAVGCSEHYATMVSMRVAETGSYAARWRRPRAISARVQAVGC
jgi:hypothetical protein